MSSQGASIGSGTTSTGGSGCYGPTATSQVPAGYTFTNRSVRDGSDWIAYKRQTLILNESKTRGFQDPWFVRGNDYRLQFMEGRFKNGIPTGCSGCATSAFVGGRVTNLPNLS